jgi:hypothetical protein
MKTAARWLDLLKWLALLLVVWGAMIVAHDRHYRRLDDEYRNTRVPIFDKLYYVDEEGVAHRRDGDDRPEVATRPVGSGH